MCEAKAGISAIKSDVRINPLSDRTDKAEAARAIYPYVDEIRRHC
jgi:hypothetical protein